MQLTRVQQQLLTFYSQCSQDGVSLLSVWRWRVMVIQLVLFGGFAAVCFAISEVWVGTFALGIIWGALMRDLGYTRRFILLWPVVKAITNWEQVEKLRATNELPSEIV